MESREIPDGWKETTLGEIIKTNESSISKEYNFDKILYLDTGSITENKIEGFQLLSLEDAPSRARRIVKNDSIVYSTVRPIQRHYGILKNPPENLIASTGFAVIDCIENLSNPKYIYYLLTTNEITQKLDMIANGSVSTYPSIKPSDIENLRVIIPSTYEEQVAIGQVLSSLDEKIELLEEENKTLETLAQTIFTEWFLNFNFLGATGEMEESELGEIPKGWRVGKLGEIVEINPRYSLKKGEVSKYIEMKSISENSLIITDVIEREFSGSGTKFENNTTLMARITPCLENGKTGYVNFLENNEIAWGSTEFNVIKSKKGIPKEFSYLIARDIDFSNYAISNMNGSSGRQRVNGKILEEYSLVIGEKQVYKEFGELINPMFKKIKINGEQIQTLKITRDILLPKLTTGEIRVKGFGE